MAANLLILYKISNNIFKCLSKQHIKYIKISISELQIALNLLIFFKKYIVSSWKKINNFKIRL